MSVCSCLVTSSWPRKLCVSRIFFTLWSRFYMTWQGQHWWLLGGEVWHIFYFKLYTRAFWKGFNLSVPEELCWRVQKVSSPVVDLGEGLVRPPPLHTYFGLKKNHRRKKSRQGKAPRPPISSRSGLATAPLCLVLSDLQLKIHSGISFSQKRKLVQVIKRFDQIGGLRNWYGTVFSNLGHKLLERRRNKCQRSKTLV